MPEREIADLDAAIRDALVRLQRQRDYIKEFSVRGHDMKAAHILLSCLITNLKGLERQRHELANQMDLSIVSEVACMGANPEQLAPN